MIFLGKIHVQYNFFSVISLKIIFYQITLRQMKYLDVALDIKAFMTC